MATLWSSAVQREQSVNNTQFQDFFRKIDPKLETFQIIKKGNQIL